MPQAIPLVIAAIAYAAEYIAIEVLVMAAISTALSALSTIMMKKPQAGGSFRAEAQDRKQVIRSAIASRKKIYGTAKVSGPLVYGGSSGDGNKYAHIIIPLAGHQCNAIGDVYFNDKLSSEYDSNYFRIKKHLGSADQEADSDLVAETAEWTVDHRGRGVAYLYVRFEDNREVWPTGLPNVSAVVEGALIYDPRLSALVARGTCTVSGTTASKESGINVWDSDVYSQGSYTGAARVSCSPNQIDKHATIGLNSDPLTDQSFSSLDYAWYFAPAGLAYIYESSSNLGVFGTYTSETVFEIIYAGTTIQYLMDGQVKRTVTVAAGREFYLDSAFYSVGASVRDISFVGEVFSDNWALCVRDYLTDPVLGLGHAATEIDEGWAIASANLSDEQVEVQPGIYQPRYTCNGVVDTATDPATIIDQLRSAGAGFVLQIQGQLRIIAGAYYTPTGTALTAHELRGPLKVRPKPGRRELFNGVRGVFVSPDNYYEPTDFPVVKNATYKEQDGGVEIIQDIDLPFTNDPWMAQRIAKIVLEKGRQGIVVEYPANWGALNRCVGDTVYLDFDGGLGEPSLGWNDKVFRIESWALATDGGGIDLALQEEAAASYAWNYGEATTVDPAPDTSLASPATTPPEVGNVQIVEENYAYRLRTFTRLQVSWQFPASYPWFDFVEVWVSLDGGTTYTHHSSPKYTVTNPGVTLDPVEEGQTYFLQLITVSIHGKRATAATVVSHLVIGRASAAPTSLGSLSVVVGENSSVRAWSEQVTDSDVELYEFRLGLAWDSAIFLAALSSPNLPLPGVKPGNHTLFANTRGQNGLYGATPVSAYLTLAEPPDFWSVIATSTGDYSSGTFTNAEMVSYSGENHLKCSHTGGVLVGSYLSPVIDRGASGRYLAYLLADTVVTGEGQQWGDVVPTTTTWAQLDVSRRWREIFQPLAAPAIRMRLWYGDTSPPTNVVDRLEILSAIIEGRYYQVEIEITDPALNINGLVEHYTLKLCQ